jgi:hypothetical protein
MRFTELAERLIRIVGLIATSAMLAACAMFGQKGRHRPDSGSRRCQGKGRSCRRAGTRKRRNGCRSARPAARLRHARQALAAGRTPKPSEASSH